ncbi:hypothetical protein [Persephonella sp.]
MRRISFTVFVIWAVVFFAVWYFFDFAGIYNSGLFYIFSFQVDVRTAVTFFLQMLILFAYFKFFQRENSRDAFLRSFLFNFLVYLVYILIYMRAQGV